jgi:hypothetical protein
MGKRKFRLSVKKNYERKKYASKNSEAALIVQIPMAVYHDVDRDVSHLKYLIERIASFKIVPFGWWIEVHAESLITISKIIVDHGLTMKIIIHGNFEWAIQINNEEFPNYSFPQFQEKKISNVRKVSQLLTNADNSHLCIGNPDRKSFEIRDERKGQFLDKSGKNVIAFFDERQLPYPTIRYSKCHIFIEKGYNRCLKCEEHRATLHSFVSRSKKQHHSQTPISTSSHINYRFMTPSEKDFHMHALQREKRALQLKVKRLEGKLAAAIEATSITLDDEISSDFQKIMADEEECITKEYSKDSFPYIFWKQQQNALARKGSTKNEMRWHPLIIKWCLYIRHHSSKAYEALRESSCISLPSQLTLTQMPLKQDLVRVSHLMLMTSFYKLPNLKPLQATTPL